MWRHMSTPAYRVRRATLDDMSQLTALWNAMHLPADDLSRRVTEFQVAEGADGHIAGALGLQIAGTQGRLHSESFADFALADELRAAFLARIQAMATNHGLLRLWTKEQAPFWKRNGFQAPSPDALKKVPEAWEPAAPDWQTLALKDEEVVASLEKQLAIYMVAEKQRTAETLARARVLKILVTVLAFLVAFAIFGAAIYVYVQHRRSGGSTGG